MSVYLPTSRCISCDTCSHELYFVHSIPVIFRIVSYSSDTSDKCKFDEEISIYLENDSLALTVAPPGTHWILSQALALFTRGLSCSHSSPGLSTKYHYPPTCLP